MRTQHLSGAVGILFTFFCIGTGQDFPPDFLFGSASAAYQIEGGWDADGKGPNIWDELTHKKPEKIFDGSNGDIACNSYEFFRDDVQLLKDANMDFYRFSISWARVMSKGDRATINEAGLTYYDNLINALIEAEIEPMITMYHWDLPQALQEIGGMTNPLIVKYFEDYADLLLERFSDRVKYWSTFNEPILICESGYSNNDFAPSVFAPGVGSYLCSHHLLIAHAKVYDLFHGKYRKDGNKMGIVLNCGFSFPLDPNNPADVEAADRAMQFSCGWYAHPIFSKVGGYPPVMVQTVAERSLAEGRAWSRLPDMSATVRDSIRGKSDFFGLNYYTSSYATPGGWQRGTSFRDDQYVQSSIDPSWPVAASTWLRSVPEGLRGMLKWIKDQCEDPEIIITENGWSDDDGKLEDLSRIEYLRVHLQAVLDARFIDNVTVTGHTTWSILDNFEWRRGYSEKFGIHAVDLNDPMKTRTAKNSVAFLRNIILTRRLP